MLKKMIGLIVCMLLLFTPAVMMVKAGNEQNVIPNTHGAQAAVSMTSPQSVWDGWELQWSYAYGGMGHSQLAQPVGDLDGDGVNEIIVGGYENSGMCRIISYDAIQKTYVEEHAWYVPGGSYHIPTGACILDVNGDGVLELCVAWGYTGADGLYTYSWDGTTLTTLDWYHGTGVDWLYDCYACDYNDDGTIEVLISNAPNMGPGDTHVSALGWDTVNQKFSYEISWSCPGGANMECPMVWSGDVDNDGLTEVIADVSEQSYATAGTWALNWNSDTQSWDGVPVWTNYGGATVYGDGVADIDGDGTPEIGIGSYGGTPQGWLFEWDGSTYQQVWNGQYPSGQPVIESVALGDADNDGRQEFVFGTQQVHVIGWDGTAYYEKTTLTDPQSMLAGMNICDFDTDGLNELKACEIISGTGSEFIWKYHVADTVPPVTICMLSGEMSGDIYTSNVTVTLTVTDNGSGVDYTKYKLDAGGWSTYTVPFVVSVDGNHTISFYSVDRNGNTEQEKHRSFTIQTHAYLNVTVTGGRGISVVVENQGLLPDYKVPWSIALDGGLLLLGRSKIGVLPGLMPDEKSTLTSSVFGFGKVTIVITVGDVQKTATGFVVLFFVLGVS